MTLMDCMVDDHYGPERKAELRAHLIKCVNKEVLTLAESGCTHIQIDEPVLMRYPDNAFEYGVDDLKQCFKGVPSHVTTVTHLCCGYPQYLDQDDYVKADKVNYQRLAPLL